MPLLPLILVGSALAQPPDFTVLVESEGCVVAISPRRTDEPRTLRSECWWPEALLAPVRALLTDYTAYPRIVPNIRTATVLRTEQGRTLVHQEHDIPLFSDREILLWMWNTERADGGVVVSWQKADVPFEPKAGHSVVNANFGHWEVWPGAAGGLHVVHEVAYDPGIRVPDWLAKRYRTTGIVTVMRLLRERATGVDTVP